MASLEQEIQKQQERLKKLRAKQRAAERRERDRVQREIGKRLWSRLDDRAAFDAAVEDVWEEHGKPAPAAAAARGDDVAWGGDDG